MFNSGNKLGDLNNNLTLQTKGKVYINYGKKFFELLNDKGELNVKFPKYFQKKDSVDEISSNGIFLINDSLYINIEGLLFQLAGSINDKFLSYTVDQQLTEEQKELAIKNLGIENFSNILKQLNKLEFPQDGTILTVNNGNLIFSSDIVSRIEKLEEKING